MKSIVNLYMLLFAALCSNLLHAQQDDNFKDRFSSKYREGNRNAEVTNSFKESNVDYRIISSNNSYIEIEFYPYYTEHQQVNYRNERLSVINFENYIEQSSQAGSPNLKFRSFPVILPSEENNVLAVIDYDVNEVKNINLAPVPNVRLIDPRRRDFENYILTYDKDAKAYSQNKFMPSELLSLGGVGLVRELTMGNLIVYPYQYNPVTKVLKQYTRIRFRITFGTSPVPLNRKRSNAEEDLLKGIAVNSNIALNWMSPKLINYRTNPVIPSVLSTGDWHRIEIRDNGSGGSEGIYKLTRSFLESGGMNFSNIDPRTIKVYGNGGYLLPESINELRPQDLVQIAIYFEGENDGVFDPQDYILFYGRSINNWNYDTASRTFSHYINYYSNSNYYWININTGGNGKRMMLVQSENVQNPIMPSSFTEKLFYEPEISNLIFEGNLWFSERKSNGQSFVWNSTLTGLEANTDILYKIKPVARVICPPQYNIGFNIREEQSSVSEIYFPLGCVYGGFTAWISTDSTSFTINASQKSPPNSEQSTFKATFITDSPQGEGYLDWMEIQYKRRFNGVSNDFLRFTSPDTNGTVEYNVSSFSNNPIKVFNITSHSDVALVNPLSITSNSVRFQKTQVQSQLNYFMISGPNGYKIPTPGSISQRIPNQNLRGYTEGASFIIMTHRDLLPAAQRLKARREAGGQGNPNYLKTYIVECQSIYNEFSGGVLDAVAIRDFIKYAYDNWQQRPVYVLFFGDGDFDYKSILINDPNWVPAFEFTDPNLHLVNGYTTDDFYTHIMGSDLKPDVAHGRITAQSLAEANGYIDKVECYEDASYNGYWKNRCTYVADDGWTTSGYPEGSQHTDQCESLAEQHTPSVFEKAKLYLVAYPIVITSQGRRKPDVNLDIIKHVNAGSMILHYTGHGSPEVWAHEYVYEKDVAISQMKNKCKYPFLSVASCDHTKFDNPLSQSGGEAIVMTPNKGAIGSLAATRPVYAGQNSAFVNKFYDELMYPRDTLLLQTRFGKAAFLTKQVLNSVNDLKYALICDPTVRVQIPRFRSRIDSISGLSNDTMRALSRIKIYGSVINPDSSLWTGYNGKIFLKIFDVTRNIDIIDEYNYLFRYKIPGGIIFSGTQTITNGKWSVEYIVPKDISYQNQNGKLIDYFYNSQADGSGEYTNFIVGGIDPFAPIDTTGPDIKVYLNTRNFRSGDIVNENFKLIADFFDESGINTTGTIGHKIEAVLDNNVNNKYDLTSFYNSDTTYKSGSLEYDFLNISEGSHIMSIKAWDTYNNSSEAQINFNISTYSSLKVANIYNYPNPFKDNTTFTFQHNYPNAINVKIKIYTVAGRLIKEISQDNINDKFVTINWPGKDEDGETLGNGIYIYKLIVQSADGNSVTNVGKVAVLK